MPSLRVCVLFRPLNSKEKSDHGDSITIRGIDSESFVFKDEKEEEIEFHFDKVFFQGSEQADIYEFLALPIIKGVVSGVNGAIITYGQTGAGKTYSMEGPSIVDCDEKRKGLLPRVVDGIFNIIKPSDDKIKFTVKLSMVEIYMERVRDLFDLSKDNLQIKENKMQGIFVNGVTEISISDYAEALRTLSNGIANRAVGETQMNMTSSRSHCIYIFMIQHEAMERKYGKLILVDLAGSEKAERTGAEGRVLEEAKTINRSLSALGNVINVLSSPGKGSHIPYRDSKLTRILQDAIGGKAQTALLCCCSPSPSNASESLSTLRFGARAKHVKQSVHVSPKEDEERDRKSKPPMQELPLLTEKPSTTSPSLIWAENDDQIIEKVPSDASSNTDVSSTKNESSERILEKLAERLAPEDVQLLEQLLIQEGIFFDPNSVEEVESAYEDVTSRTISSVQRAVEELVTTVAKLKKQNESLTSLLLTASTTPRFSAFNMVSFYEYRRMMCCFLFITLTFFLIFKH